ncbi:hypothetical protein GCM10025794_35640 [Massilia kyonggiensis]
MDKVAVALIMVKSTQIARLDGKIQHTVELKREQSLTLKRKA